MNALGRRIAKLIETQGPLSIAQFMTIALHDPAKGYYTTRDPLGAKGDFITAPEISQMFGELIGLWCVAVWQQQEQPTNLRLVELGPGRGTLMDDALRAAKTVPAFLESADIVMIESSARLRDVQAERLKGFPVSWSERYEAADRPLLLIANEFFDALPIRQFVRTERGWCERMVVTHNDSLGFALSPAPTLIPEEREALLGGVIEIAPAAAALAEDIGRTIARWGGAALVFDYGYARPGFGETLQAVGKHRFEDVLTDPGRVDISAHVDFAILAAAARRGGAVTFGPVGQGAFLERLGIRERASVLAEKNPDQAAAIEKAVERLTSAAAMGELFKVLAIMPPNLPPPPGFDHAGA